MALQLRRPILVGGLGLTASLWLLEGFHPHSAAFGGTALWGAIALGAGVWWWRQQSQTPLDLALPSPPVDRTAVEKELTAVETLLNQWATDFPEHETTAGVTPFRQRLTQLTQDMERRQISLSILGGSGVGKTTLTQQLASFWKTSSNSAAAANLDLEPSNLVAVNTSDLVLFVVTGDVTEPEYQAIAQLRQRQQRVVVIINKQDQYLPADRLLVLQQVRDRVQPQLAPDDVVAVTAQPAPLKVRQHQADGSIQERWEQPEPDLADLKQRLDHILSQEGPQLVLATVYRQVVALKREIVTQVNQCRRDRALPLIEQSQWIAAAAAFANPVPTLDLLATAAINAQLVVDLGAIYQQTFSLEQAKTVAGALAEQMIKLGLVEMASQAIAPVLKSHALTYVAGGVLQGISAAYLTRIAGLTLVEFFEEQSQRSSASESAFPLEQLIQKLKAVFQDNQRTAFLQNLVRQGISRLVPQAAAQI